MLVSDLVNGILTKINAIAPGEPIAPEDSTLVLAAINLYLDSLNAGVKKSLFAVYDPALFTFNPVADLVNLTDPITLPTGWPRALLFNVAVDVGPDFGKQPDQALIAKAAESRAAILTPLPPPPQQA